MQCLLLYNRCSYGNTTRCLTWSCVNQMPSVEEYWNCFCPYWSEIYSQKIYSMFSVPKFVVLCTDSLILPIWENNTLMVCTYIITENSTISWTLIYSVLFTTMIAALLCRLDKKLNTIWYPTVGVIILDSVFCIVESCSLAVCEQSWYESHPDIQHLQWKLCFLKLSHTTSFCNQF
jgi:hypothetical protein